MFDMRRPRHACHCHHGGVECKQQGGAKRTDSAFHSGAHEVMCLHCMGMKARLVDGRASDQDGPSGVCGARRAQDGHSDALAAAIAVCGGVKRAAAPGGGQRLRCKTTNASERAGLLLHACNMRPCVAWTNLYHCMLPMRDWLCAAPAADRWPQVSVHAADARPFVCS